MTGRSGLFVAVQKFVWCVAPLLAVCLAGCGGSEYRFGNVKPTIASVTVTCSPASIQSGSTSQCKASVTGTGRFTSRVTWSASAGQINSSGLFTAPVVLATTSVTITATSVQDSTKSGSTMVTVTLGQSASNVAPIVVDAGPQPQTFITANEAFVTVTVCIPNTNTCQAIDHVQVDTGSSGLRLLSSAGGGPLGISLPNELDSSGNPLLECAVFGGGYTWGNVARADITVAGETASSVPMQVVIPSDRLPAVPASCSGQTSGPDMGNSVMALGANGIIGVGLFQRNCGVACTSQNQNIPNVYYDCQSGCTAVYVTLAQEVTNPVILFPTDNNGVLIQLPAEPDGGSLNPSGNLIFGIGTQANNGLGNVTVYTVTNVGDFTTTFNGKSYPASFIDSGSNGLFFLDSRTTGIPTCPSPDQSWYCPNPSPDNLSAVNQGLNGNHGTVNFSIEDATTLFGTGNTGFSTLGGPMLNRFDWGLSFFFGRNMFTAIQGMNTPGGLGPYFAY